MSRQIRRRSRSGPELDSMLVRNQPALRTSSGAIWIIVAAVFTAVCLVPLIGIVASGGVAGAVASTTAVVIVLLLAAMVVVRLTVREGPPRLTALAVCFLVMAIVALAGMAACVLIVWTPAAG